MKDNDIFKSVAYMIASEKLQHLLFEMESVYDFFEEYDLDPDDLMSEIFSPILQKYVGWLRGTAREQEPRKG